VTVLSNCPPPNVTPPRLTVTRLSGCLLQLCWADPGGYYALQSVTNLTLPVAWQPLDAPVSALNGQSCVTLSNVCQGTRWFRLALARLPMLNVVAPAVTPTQFAALSAQLNLPSSAYDTNGA